MLKLIYGPDPIFSQKAQPVTNVTDDTRLKIKQMFEIMYAHQGVGLGANMVGLLEKIIVIDLQEGGVKQPIAMVNPRIREISQDTQSFEEGSLSFPGISAEIIRPKSICVKYLDEHGTEKQKHAAGWLAQVIQHEIDYLDGVIFLDYLSKLKKQTLLKKLKKTQKVL